MFEPKYVDNLWGFHQVHLGVVTSFKVTENEKAKMQCEIQPVSIDTDNSQEAYAIKTVIDGVGCYLGEQGKPFQFNSQDEARNKITQLTQS